MADDEMISFERQDNGVAWVTLNRPKVHDISGGQEKFAGGQRIEPRVR